jgi:hypothetical protein
MLDDSSNSALKPREERQRVMLPARMRTGSGWSDACILNISRKGLLVYSSGSAEPGSFVEIRRGGQLVVARVVWRRNQRIGLRSPDPVRIEDIITTETAASAVQASIAQFHADRRRLPRNGDKSRNHARAMEFMAVILAATALAGAAVSGVNDALGAPLAAVRVALGAH